MSSYLRGCFTFLLDLRMVVGVVSEDGLDRMDEWPELLGSADSV